MIEKPLQLEDDISHKNCIRELRIFQRLLIDQSNDNEESIAALESRVKKTEMQLEAARDVGTINYKSFDKRVKALEDKSKYHRHCKSSDHDDFTTQPRYFYQELENGETDAIKTAELSTSAAKTDNMSAQNVDKLDHGRWICNNCGKDWGGIGLPSWKYKNLAYNCVAADLGCRGIETVTWHPTESGRWICKK